MDHVLITGSNRGLGLEWARQYAHDDWRVYATCRNPERADALQQLAVQHANLTVHRLNVTRPEQIAELAVELHGTPIDVLINNAGIYREHWGKDPLGKIDYQDWLASFDVNTLGAMRVSEALIEHVAYSKRRLIVTITSQMGSIFDINSPKDYAYRSSKAALNAAMKGLSLEVAERGVGVLLLHPGWVRTDMGGEAASLSPQDSVRAMRKVVERFELAQSGHFYRYDGSEMPW